MSLRCLLIGFLPQPDEVDVITKFSGEKPKFGR